MGTTPTGHPSPDILQHKWYLYLTEFFAGMAVMAVELGASRLIAPYFSSSQIVWTIIIGTIMIAMALGNIYGGRAADRDPDPDKLYRRILIAAVWIAAIPFAGKFVILAVTALLVVTVSTNLLIWAALITCLIVFVFPLFLLGTVTPSLAKFAVESLDDSGKTVGALGAYNTVGSIIGTFVPTFISIPAVGTAVTFLIFAGILLLLGVVYFLFSKRGRGRMLAAAVPFVLLCALTPSVGFAFWQDDLVYEGESVYNYLQVQEDDREVILSTNVLFGVQSVYMKDGGLSGMYYDVAMAAPFMSQRPDASCDILVLGMGTGTYAKQCSEHLGDMNVRVEGVEIDGKIISLSHEYFDLPESIKVTQYDGRAFLNVCQDRYDVIMVDAYQDITIPFQMSSVEFFTLLEQHLKPGGVPVVNMNMRVDAADGINTWLSDTIASCFPYVYVVDVPYSGNRELFASNDPAMLERFEAQLPGIAEPALRRMMDRVDADIVPYHGGGLILTDDKAPVELLGMAAIDELIQEELAYYKEAFRRDGISALLG
ncbi:MAG: fused MFS/spermidine synthase [Coriobacteriales bacterium]|nr:fused MFS/spermidine synthase [Coriobacteriales bacterium]